MKLISSSKRKKISPAVKKEENAFPVVAIGASVGGLEAVSILLKNLPSDTGMAFIYVQHLHPDHKSFLTSILSKITKMKVQEIENMEHMVPNNVYVIPSNKIIKVTNGHIKLLPRPKNSSSISIDVLFASLAETHKENVIGIVLSGNASDGTIGLKAIKDAGGLTFAQDDSAQAGSMPKSAIDAGVVDLVLAPQEIAKHLIRYSKKNSVKGSKGNSQMEDNDPDLKAIFQLLLKETGVDFSYYKMSTIKRRINHKMLQCGAKTIRAYLKLLEKKNGEIDQLYGSLLINVTNFFRDAAVFTYLRTVFLPKLLKDKSQEETIRIWVPACSSGEEAYSIAMLISDLQRKRSKKISVQIFATDLSEQAIEIARLGEYSEASMKSVSKKYREQFFIKTGNTYRIIKELREMCVFAPHNILRDPPFSRMDFVSCCNLLIYFDNAAQKKVFATIHFALNEKGHLMLGKAESVGTSSPLFNRINNKFKIYSRKKNTGVPKILELTPQFSRSNPGNKKNGFQAKSISLNPLGIENAIDAVLLSNYMPACVVVNKDMEILQFRGPVSLFLTHASGKASLNILKMAKPEFAFELRHALHKVLKTKDSVYKTGIEIEIESVYRAMSFDVSPLKIEWDEQLFLIVFTMQEQIDKFIDKDKIEKTVTTQKDRRIKKLTEELNTTRADMNSIIESQERTYEELQAANEEIVSTNEEFQTLNEELETSKEEIQASNEELLSTNHELQTRNDLLSESYDYSEAIIATVHEPMLVLKKDFHVQSANKSFYKKFRVKREETEGKYLFELGNNQWDIPNLKKLLSDVLSQNTGFEDFEVISTFPGIGEKVMLLNAHPIIQKTHSEKLILLAIEDITDRSYYYMKEKKSLSLIEASLDPLVTISVEGKITDMNDATVNITGIPRKKLTGSDFFEYFTEPEQARSVYKEVFSKGSVVDSPLTIKHKEGKLTDVLFNGSVYKDDHGNVLGVVVVARDVTEQKRISVELTEAKVFAELATEIAIEAKSKAEQAARIAEVAVNSKQQFLSNMSHEIRTPMNAIIGFTKVVLKTDLNERQKEYINAIKVSGDALIVLINDILDLAKVDAGKMKFEQTPFRLEASIKAILHLFEIKIQEKNLLLVNEYDSAIPEIVEGDAVRLHQILLNLLSNAVKFTTNGKITVSVNLLKEDEKKVILEFAVKDTGIGIAKNMLKDIFDDFQQATSETSRLYGGTGLGLAIVKQLVESQGGTISVKSEEGIGSTFAFELEFKKTTAIVDIENEIELNESIRSGRVLVVEDIKLNQLLMKTLLEEFGLETDIAGNGIVAIEKLKKNEYDLILMDLQMPEMNGFETTEYIRNKMKSSIPIVALTADVTTVDLEKCKAVGMDDYVSKPIDEKLLYLKIVKHLQKKSGIGHESDEKKIKYADLTYIRQRAKNNSKLIVELLSAYLKQTPSLIGLMKSSLPKKDWKTLSSAAHKMIPSFSIIGMHADFENMAREIQEYADQNSHIEIISGLVLKLEEVCMLVCEELKEEIHRIEG